MAVFLHLFEVVMGKAYERARCLDHAVILQSPLASQGKNTFVLLEIGV